MADPTITVLTDIAVQASRFADALGKVKRAHDRNGGTILTADEVHGLIWGIRTLRGSDEDDADDNTAQRGGAAAGRP